jgi:tryptophanyl-tRNA synthetase
MKKKIMAIETDSKWLDEPKDPDTCNIYALMKFFAPQEQLDTIAQKYRAGWYGYGHAKLELLDIILEYFKQPRAKYFNNDEDFDASIEEKLKAWNIEASAIVAEKYNNLKQIVGL